MKFGLELELELARGASASQPESPGHLPNPWMCTYLIATPAPPRSGLLRSRYKYNDNNISYNAIIITTCHDLDLIPSHLSQPIPLLKYM